MNLSVVLPVYNEKYNIKKFIRQIHNINNKIEIIAVDNNSDDGSDIEIKQTKAKYFFCKKKGYGKAIRFGLSKATRDYIILCEPDGTFDVRDIIKIYRLRKKYDCIFGTRTNSSFIFKGAKMNFLFRFGNIFVAKLLQFLFNSIKLSDVGCTLKLITKKDYLKIKNKLNVEKSHFQPELMINLILLKKNIIEIPVRYYKRVGFSKITNNYFKTTILALKMILLILILRVKN